MHIPVLFNECLDALAPQSGGVYIDGTLGGGGHSEAILEASAPSGVLLGLDRDEAAIERCKARLGRFGERFIAVHSDFARMAEVAAAHGVCGVDGILLDLGVSSFQIDEADRGFSFREDGPLDMRMDRSRGETAAQLLDRLSSDVSALARLLRDYGEEPQSARVARAIASAHAQDPIRTTARLAEVVESALGGRRGRARHPATRTFQALRIAVNRELEQIQTVLEVAIRLLKPGGVLAVISFHSLEDRIVKHTFAEHEGREEALYEGGSVHVGLEPRAVRVNRHPIVPTEAECQANPRARSAKLRVLRRV